MSDVDGRQVILDFSPGMADIPSDSNLPGSGGLRTRAQRQGRKMRKPSVIVILMMAGFLAANHPSRAAPGDSDAYRAGTDIGALYLSEHMARLKITLLLRECGEEAMSHAVGDDLPNTADYARQKLSASELTPEEIDAASQITRAYVLGYEVGVRVEFRREKDQAQVERLCAGTKDFAVQNLGGGG
jgi:hypothetical protein